MTPERIDSGKKILVGMFESKHLYDYRKMELTVKQGNNHFAASFLQSKQVIICLSSVNKTLNLLFSIQKKPLPLYGRVLIYTGAASIFSALALNALACGFWASGYQQGITTRLESCPEVVKPFAKKYAQFIEKHHQFFNKYSGSICQVAFASFQVLNYTLGAKEEVYASLGMFCFQWLDSNNFFPQRLSWIFNSTLSPLSTFGGLLHPSYISKSLASFDIISQWLAPFISFEELFDLYCLYALFPLMDIKKEVLRDYPSLWALNGKSQTPELSLEQIRYILKEANYNPDINPCHVNLKTHQHTSYTTSFETFYTLFDSLDWESSISILEARLWDDEKFKDEFLTGWRNWNQATIEEKKQALKREFPNWKEELIHWSKTKGLTCFVDNLNGRKKPQGEIDQQWFISKNKARGIAFILNEKLELANEANEYLKGNTENLSDKLKEAIGESSDIRQSLINFIKEVTIEREDILARLAIEGGDYCITAMKTVINQIYDQLQLSTDNESIQCKVAHLLAESRKRFFQSYYSSLIDIINRNPLQSLKTRENIRKQFQDRHFYNEALLAYGHGLGLDMQEAANDSAIKKDPLLTLIMSGLFPIIRQNMWKKQLPFEKKLEKIKEYIREELGQGIDLNNPENVIDILLIFIPELCSLPKEDPDNYLKLLVDLIDPDALPFLNPRKTPTPKSISGYIQQIKIFYILSMHELMLVSKFYCQSRYTPEAIVDELYSHIGSRSLLSNQVCVEYYQELLKDIEERFGVEAKSEIEEIYCDALMDKAMQSPGDSPLPKNFLYLMLTKMGVFHPLALEL